MLPTEEEQASLLDGEYEVRGMGQVREDYDVIELQGVPIVTPPVKGKDGGREGGR